jgi:hypothetical protein
MAFINFNDAAPQAGFTSTLELSGESRSDPAGTLSAIERRVVELAREDDLGTLRPTRKRGWFARLILGPAPASSMLANEKLEALRRLAVQAWHKGYMLPASALREAHAAGYSEDQISAVVDSIGRSRAPFRRLAA